MPIERYVVDGLVRTHEPAVADDIGGQDGSQLPLDTLWQHREPSLPDT